MPNTAPDFLTLEEKVKWQGEHGFNPTTMWKVILPRLITEAFQRLLEEKHLYQSVRVQEAAVVQKAVEFWGIQRPTKGGGSGMTMSQVAANPPVPSKSELEKGARDDLETVLSYQWDSKAVGTAGLLWLQFSQPRPVIAFCPACKNRAAFNPTTTVGLELPLGWGGKGKSADEQHFTFAYECQQCRDPSRERLVFLMVRRGGKITLAGRDPLESVSIERFIPPEPGKFLRDAIIAHQSGQTLAGNFLLRTFIEQFWRMIPEVESLRKDMLGKSRRASGDELGDAYSALLPDVFRERFPSLKKVYGDLSEAIHEARIGEDASAIFTSAVQQINKHFDARRVFELA